MAKEKSYLIVPMSELTQQMVNDCVQTSMQTIRKNNDETECVLKYVDDEPASVAGYKNYKHKQILIELTKAEWVSTPLIP